MGNKAFRQPIDINKYEHFSKRIEIGSAQINQEKDVCDIDYDSNYLIIKYPHISVSVDYRIAYSPKWSESIWQFGFIQGMTSQKCFKLYKANITVGRNMIKEYIEKFSLEHLVLNKRFHPMINDSNRSYSPWYQKSHIYNRDSRISPTFETITLKDKPTTRFSIQKPSQYIEKHLYLTAMERASNFYTWFIAMNLETFEYIILRTFKWDFKLKCTIDEKGITSSNDCNNYLCEKNFRIPNCVFFEPVANHGFGVFIDDKTIYSPNCTIGPFNDVSKLVEEETGSMI